MVSFHDKNKWKRPHPKKEEPVTSKWRQNHKMGACICPGCHDILRAEDEAEHVCRKDAK